MSRLNASEIHVSIGGFRRNFGRDNLASTFAAVGDVVIGLAAFWINALTARSRDWIIRPKTIQVAGFIAIGIVITVVVEAVAIQHSQPVWHYVTTIPMLPPAFVRSIVPLQQISIGLCVCTDPMPIRPFVDCRRS